MRWRLGRAHNNLFPHFRIDFFLAAAALGIDQTCQTGVPETLFPLDDHRPADAHGLGRFGLTESIGAIQDDPRALVIAERRRGTVDNSAQRAPLFSSDRYWADGSCHARMISHRLIYVNLF